MTVIGLFHNLGVKGTFRSTLLGYILSQAFFSVLIFASEPTTMVGFKSLNPIDQTTTAIQGGLLLGQTEAGNQVWLNGKKIRVTSDGTFILGFGRDDKKAELKILSPQGVKLQNSLMVESRQYKIERVDGLPPAKVNPRGEAVTKRIKAEAVMVKKVRQLDDPRIDFLTGFIWPAKGRISGVYGSQRILNGQPKWPHYGLDIATPTGSQVVAPAAGIVSLAQPDLYYSGGTLIIDHGHGLTSTFLHLSEILVEVGQSVDQGSQIAKVGATGRATGPHLDWRINWFNVRLDPLLLVQGLAH